MSEHHHRGRVMRHLNAAVDHLAAEDAKSKAALQAFAEAHKARQDAANSPPTTEETPENG